MQTISHRAAHTVLEDVSLRPSPQGQLYTFLPTCIIFSFSDVFSLLGSFLQVLEIFYAVSGSHRVPRWSGPAHCQLAPQPRANQECPGSSPLCSVLPQDVKALREPSAAFLSLFSSQKLGYTVTPRHRHNHRQIFTPRLRTQLPYSTSKDPSRREMTLCVPLRTHVLELTL